jgi:Tfp pilus assembly protein PilV
MMYTRRRSTKAFTLVETMVATSILVIAVAGPMTLASRSLASGFYARDQVTAFHMAQEALEVVRAVRDQNILLTLSGTPTSLLEGVPSTDGQPFIVDARDNSMVLCNSVCPPIENNGTLYGYGTTGWNTTRFTRTVTASFVNGNTDELRVSVEVRWRSGVFQERSFTIRENLYRWAATNN